MLKILLIFAFALVLISTINSSFAQSEDKLVILETAKGNIVIEFFPEDAPTHVSNFINLTDSGYYDGVLFHRIIPGFMIQGGDPNTKTDDQSTWGLGGPSNSVNAEFNDIKHNRGIVSMARSQNPNSAGSQFFIVHENSNFLDQQYTVFGRIVTDESFETLDKIASVNTLARDIPENPDEVVIIKATTASRSEVSNLLDLGEPERVDSSMDIPTQPLEGNGTQLFENEDLDVAFSAPESWVLQEPPKQDENTPDVVAVGPRIGQINPVISLRVDDKNGRTFDDYIEEKNALLDEVISTGNLAVTSQKRITIEGKEAYVTEATGLFQTSEGSINVKFKETTFLGPDKFYTFAYSNGIDDFDNHLEKYDDSINSFKILSAAEEETGNMNEEGGGCLIATATFDSELAPQVQQLRELRDNTILSTQSGTTFMTGFNEFYYSFSPTIADLERENPAFKEAVKITITPMLTSLSILNYVDIDSEQELLGYGISIIALNIGMYFALPAILINKFRN